jgi:hypothetical protein
MLQLLADIFVRAIAPKILALYVTKQWACNEAVSLMYF